MFDPTTLVGFHTWLSLVAIAAGFPITAGLLGGRVATGWTSLYWITAFAMSATGFLFPVSGFLPSHAFGVLSILLLIASAYSLYGRGLAGGWGRVYAVTTLVTFYLLLFVLIVQLFLKVPALHALAPTQGEPPFAIAQGVLLVIFGALIWRAFRRFGGARSAAA